MRAVSNTEVDPNRPPRPTCAALGPEAVPNELRGLAPSLRAELLAGLALSLEAAATAHDHLRQQQATNALLRVLAETDRASLEQTLEEAAALGSIGFIAEQVGVDALMAVGKARGLNVNDLLARSDTVKLRGLTTFEARAVDRNFGASLDPLGVRLRFTTGELTREAPVVVIGDTIHLDPLNPKFAFQPGTTLPQDPHSWQYQEVVLAHAVAHVWAWRHRDPRAYRLVEEQLGALHAGGGREAAYHYEVGEPSFLRYSEEQQAMIVEDYVACERALGLGKTSLFLWGAMRWVEPSRYLAELEPYLRELRGSGPGTPPLHTAPQAFNCSGVFRREGAAAAVAASRTP